MDEGKYAFMYSDYSPWPRASGLRTLAMQRDKIRCTWTGYKAVAMSYPAACSALGGMHFN